MKVEEHRVVSVHGKRKRQWRRTDSIVGRLCHLDIDGLVISQASWFEGIDRVEWLNMCLMLARCNRGQNKNAPSAAACAGA